MRREKKKIRRERQKERNKRKEKRGKIYKKKDNKGEKCKSRSTSQLLVAY